MGSRLKIYPRCGKDVKFISDLTRYVNAYKIPITLPSYQLSIPISILEYNITNYQDLPSDNFEEDISLKVPNSNEKKIRLVDTMGNNDKNSKPTNIEKSRPTTPN